MLRKGRKLRKEIHHADWITSRDRSTIQSGLLACTPALYRMYVAPRPRPIWAFTDRPLLVAGAGKKGWMFAFRLLRPPEAKEDELLDSTALMSEATEFPTYKSKLLRSILFPRTNF